MTINTVEKKTINWWDLSGVFFSTLCMVHCVVTPILLAGATIWFASEWVHVGFFVLLIPIVIIAARRTCSTERTPWVVFFLYAGLGIIGAGLVLGETLGERFEITATLLGSALLIIGHLKNWHAYSRTR